MNGSLVSPNLGEETQAKERAQKEVIQLATSYRELKRHNIDG